jgi:hypothetical protein
MPPHAKWASAFQSASLKYIREEQQNCSRHHDDLMVVLKSLAALILSISGGCHAIASIR